MILEATVDAAAVENELVKQLDSANIEDDAEADGDETPEAPAAGEGKKKKKRPKKPKAAATVDDPAGPPSVPIAQQFPKGNFDYIKGTRSVQFGLYSIHWLR